MESSYNVMKPVEAALTSGCSFQVLHKDVSDKDVDAPWLDSSNKRPDGRGLNEIPRLFFALDCFNDYEGSATFTMGGSQVTVGVRGPFPNIAGASNTNRPSAQQNRRNKQILVSSSSRTGASLKIGLKSAYSNVPQQGVNVHTTSYENFLTESSIPFSRENDKELAEQQRLTGLAESVLNVMKCTILTSAYTGAVISADITIISEDFSSILPCIVNCLSLALMRASIKLLDTVSAVCVHVVSPPASTQRASKPVICIGLSDLERKMLSKQGSSITDMHYAMHTHKRTLAMLSVNGLTFNGSTDEGLVHLAEAACVAISKELTECIKQNLNT